MGMPHPAAGTAPVSATGRHSLAPRPRPSPPRGYSATAAARESLPQARRAAMKAAQESARGNSRRRPARGPVQSGRPRAPPSRRRRRLRWSHGRLDARHGFRRFLVDCGDGVEEQCVLVSLGREAYVGSRADMSYWKTTVKDREVWPTATRYTRMVKRELYCTGILQELSSIILIQLQGDPRKRVATFHVRGGLATKANIKINGFYPVAGFDF